MTTITAITCKKIDIHSHILNSVDHGCSSLESAIENLKIARDLNIRSIFCTSHFVFEDKNYDYNFDILHREAKKIGITLYKGHEIKLKKTSILEVINKRANSLNNSMYLLFELSRINNYTQDEIIEMLEELIEHGYKIIFAHPELIKNAFNSKKEILKYKNLGVLFQLDADSYFIGYKRKVLKLLKWGFVDFVASDFHEGRKSFKLYDKFYKLLTDKYGYKYTKKLFYDNPKRVLENKNIK